MPNETLSYISEQTYDDYFRASGLIATQEADYSPAKLFGTRGDSTSSASPTSLA